MLSGIGPVDEWQRHGIEVLLDLPDVGHHFHNHPGVSQWWKLKHPEKGHAVRSPPSMIRPSSKVFPRTFVITQSVSKDGLRNALAKDDPSSDPDNHPLVSVQRGHVETSVFYVGLSPKNPKIAMDGTHITVVCMRPTSRGSITLADNDPRRAPLIDPNYFATEVDRYVMREGLREVQEVMCYTPAGQEIVKEEIVEDGASPLSADTSDGDIDSLIRRRLM